MRGVLWAFSALLMGSVAGSCGTQKETATVLDSQAAYIGTLYLKARGHPNLLRGVIQYRFYDTGDVFYSGDIIYDGWGTPQGSGEIRAPFYGNLTVQPSALLSSTYTIPGAVQSAIKLDFTTIVHNPQAQQSIVYGQVVDTTRTNSPDASGHLRISTQGDIIEIIEMEIEGSVLNIPHPQIRFTVLASQTPLS